ncbi:EAL domain-containing protein, partial [Kosakonia oryziphila]
LTRLLPRHQRPVMVWNPPGSTNGRLSPEEQAFELAVHQGHVFPVFQPVTDRHYETKGFEILIRWRRDGQEMQPADFLPNIRSPGNWLLLTAFVISEAVRQINATAGDWYFAINVPAFVAGSKALISMLETARQQLNDPTRAERLVLEFSETTDVSRSGVKENIREMQRGGHRILLDDCFSSHSVTFPARQVRFNGYKLDKSIVDTFMHNHHDASLIQSLVVYCQLNDVECIAEGVDSPEKFNALCRAGVTGFQGYYLSGPVYRESLDETVRQLQTRHNNITRTGDAGTCK